jgi:hypothetical protein
MSTRLLIDSAFHFTCWLATLRLASSAIFAGAKMLRTDHFAHWLPTFHLTAVSVETFATCGACGLIALRTTFLVALWRIASP